MESWVSYSTWGRYLAGPRSHAPPAALLPKMPHLVPPPDPRGTPQVKAAARASPHGLKATRAPRVAPRIWGDARLNQLPGGQ